MYKNKQKDLDNSKSMPPEKKFRVVYFQIVILKKKSRLRSLTKGEIKKISEYPGLGSSQRPGARFTSGTFFVLPAKNILQSSVTD